MKAEQRIWNVRTGLGPPTQGVKFVALRLRPLLWRCRGDAIALCLGKVSRDFHGDYYSL